MAKSSIQTLPKSIFYANRVTKKVTIFQAKMLEKEVGGYLRLCSDFIPVLLQICKSRKSKAKRHHFFTKRRVFPLELKLLPTALCLVRWRGRHITQELGTHFQTGEKTDRVDGP